MKYYVNSYKIYLMIKKSRDHLKSVNEKYLQHMATAFKVGLGMIYGGLMALAHGIVPAIFQTNASDKIKKLYLFLQTTRKSDN